MIVHEGQEANHRLLIIRDITERIQAQKQDFALALEKERVKLLTSFIQNAAHEFRTPLSIIGAGVYLVARIEDADQRKNKSDQVGLQVQRISNLVDMLLMMAKLESNQPLQPLQLDLSNMIAELCEDALFRYGSTPALECITPPDLPPVIGEPDNLSNALQQLIDNAYRFTPEEGTITIEIGYSSDTVWVESARHRARDCRRYLASYL